SRALTIALTVPSARMFHAIVPSSRSSTSAALKSSTAAVLLHPANMAIAIPQSSAQNNMALLRIGISFLLRRVSSRDENGESAFGWLFLREALILTLAPESITRHRPCLLRAYPRKFPTSARKFRHLLRTARKMLPLQQITDDRRGNPGR